MFQSILNKYRKPLSDFEKILYLLMAVAILLDILSTYIIREQLFGTHMISGDVTEGNIIVYLMKTNFLLGITLYYAIWVLLIFLTRINIDVEITFLLAQIITNSIGFLDNTSLIIFHDAYITKTLLTLNINKEYIILAFVLVYNLYRIISTKMTLTKGLKLYGGISLVLVLHFCITLFWVFYLLPFFGYYN